MRAEPTFRAASSDKVKPGRWAVINQTGLVLYEGSLDDPQTVHLAALAGSIDGIICLNPIDYECFASFSRENRKRH